jgi:hypothetical protein
LTVNVVPVQEAAAENSVCETNKESYILDKNTKY